MADVVELVIGEQKLTGTTSHGHRLQVGDDGDGDDGHHRKDQRQTDAKWRVVHQPAMIVVDCFNGPRYRVLARL